MQALVSLTDTSSPAKCSMLRFSGPRFTISLKRSTQNFQLSTTTPADYPIFWGRLFHPKRRAPGRVRGFVVQMLFGRSVELIVQPDAHDVEVGTATPVKHETSIALSVRCQKAY